MVGMVTRIRNFIDNLNQYFRADIYIRLLPYIRPYKWSMVVVVLLSILQTGLGLLGPWPMKILIDNGLGGQPLPDPLPQIMPFLTSRNAAAIVIFAVAAGIALQIFGNGLDIVYGYLKGRINSFITLRFKADMFRHLQRLSFSYHDQTTVGESMYRLDNDTGFVSTMVWGNFRHLLTNALTLVGILWVVISLDWQLAAVALAVAPFLYISVWLYAKLFMEKQKHMRRMESVSETIVQEVLSCLRVVKAFGMEEREQRRYEDQAWATLKAGMRLGLFETLFSSATGFVTKIDSSLILLIGGLHVLSGQLTVGELLVILAYVGQIHDPLNGIGETLTDMQMSLVSAERALEVLGVDPEITDRPDAQTLKRVSGAVDFKNVDFGYNGSNRVLHNISFSVQPGEVVAIVGPTGAGKTTMASLIARFYDPQSGQVRLDGHDLRDLTVKTLRDNIALVIQDPILFTGTIRDNIAYGRPEARMDEIVAAAKAANAHDFIAGLEDGYDSQVGERGVRLSGGERQRISIARAFLKDAPVLILDEPTSSVDSRTELVILDALDKLMEHRTTFIIAHRLSTVRRANQILVVEHGRIAERGTHLELMRRNGLYAQLYRIQFGALRAHEMVEVPA